MDLETQRLFAELVLTIMTLIGLYVIRRVFPSLDNSEIRKKVIPPAVEKETGKNESTTTNTENLATKYNTEFQELDLRERKLKLSLTEVAIDQIEDLTNHLQKTRDLANKLVVDLEISNSKLKRQRQRTKKVIKIAKIYRKSCREYKNLLIASTITTNNNPEALDNDDDPVPPP